MNTINNLFLANLIGASGISDLSTLGAAIEVFQGGSELSEVISLYEAATTPEEKEGFLPIIDGLIKRDAEKLKPILLRVNGGLFHGNEAQRFQETRELSFKLAGVLASSKSETPSVVPMRLFANDMRQSGVRKPDWTAIPEIAECKGSHSNGTLKQVGDGIDAWRSPAERARIQLYQKLSTRELRAIAGDLIDNFNEFVKRLEEGLKKEYSIKDPGAHISDEVYEVFIEGPSTRESDYIDILAVNYRYSLGLPPSRTMVLGSGREKLWSAFTQFESALIFVERHPTLVSKIHGLGIAKSRAFKSLDKLQRLISNTTGFVSHDGEPLATLAPKLADTIKRFRIVSKERPAAPKPIPSSDELREERRERIVNHLTERIERRECVKPADLATQLVAQLNNYLRLLEIELKKLNNEDPYTYILKKTSKTSKASDEALESSRESSYIDVLYYCLGGKLVLGRELIRQFHYFSRAMLFVERHPELEGMVKGLENAKIGVLESLAELGDYIYSGDVAHLRREDIPLDKLVKKLTRKGQKK
ncbi:MAG: hypothetical protein A2W61_01110 [Deltaproteobacteria bacterium RIFCSPLOWO2_01_44_7]|nr:MAG: hypothetical protein A2712_00520 [Deltaproteobacteria bacterium RIFCSPHIGHO2_01_FULL_43_49]OGQ14241.1 MAG: hypothetical protein A3D22_10095 [Deltaproteobacteria bacterium RIFCSPHIGHO2_02_FULL_44_53]OGQ27457.1 MAG: hypothetical protein A3D98_03695 [Deltaproteobacteria bacterium RIFCSPHIGHO2_12_FULL_44_21]OGQ30705.1 MAG: hypothetical protein A2979_06120 [Deltaproteobacteria bacterium RIFCSPLOWO2_01_FULL_45_74]OGQ41217.1 MAG: hypothetical protein A2W61_01110 [Deltaproteobacteria bacterium 